MDLDMSRLLDLIVCVQLPAVGCQHEQQELMTSRQGAIGAANI